MTVRVVKEESFRVARRKLARTQFNSGNAAVASPSLYRIREIPVAKIRPEEGLGRKRGQGRTLACSFLGLETIPAIVVGDAYAESEKVQQFLVENVARLKMRPIDRALLIAHARKQCEETAEVARRFGVSAATVRRLEMQLDGATATEVAALRSGNVNLAKHAVITRWVEPNERAETIALVTKYPIKTNDMASLFEALGWDGLTNLGSQYKATRLRLLRWACAELSGAARGTVKERLNSLAVNFPLSLESHQVAKVAR
jgi:hypothetical protein